MRAAYLYHANLGDESCRVTLTSLDTGQGKQTQPFPARPVEKSKTHLDLPSFRGKDSVC
jgi:hypothetical protein